MPLPPLTRSIGTAERSLRALLDRELSRAELSFAQWTVLVFTGSGGLPLGQIAQRQLAGQVIAAEAEAKDAVDRLAGMGLLVSNDQGSIRQTEKGQQLFARLSKAIEGITTSLYGDLPETDLEATHRTLLEIGSRAARLLRQSDT